MGLMKSGFQHSIQLSPECDKYIRIFEYIGHKYIFGHSFVSIWTFVRVKYVCTNIFLGECVRV